MISHKSITHTVTMAAITALIMIIFLSKTSEAVEDEVNSQNINLGSAGLPPSMLHLQSGGGGSGGGHGIGGPILSSPSLAFGNNEMMPINDPYLMSRQNNLKRSWQSLQGSWGKRASDFINNGGVDDYQQAAMNRNYHDRYMEENMDGVGTGGVGTAAINGEHEYDAAAATLNDDYDYSNVGKRAWKSMNGAWGKRVNSNWNNFRGSWGKREPGWNNLKGLWGKRAANQWNKLSSAWGRK